MFLPAAPPHTSPPPKKADNTVPSKASTEVQDARAEIMDFIHHWPIRDGQKHDIESRNVATMLAATLLHQKKMGRPACLNANIWGRWKTHIRDPSTPVDTLALSH